MTEQKIPAGYKLTEVGVIPTDWEVKKMGEIGSFYYGKSAPKHSLSPTAKTPCVRYGELYTKFNGVINKIYSYTKIPEEELKFSAGGEILIPRVGEDPLDFYKCSFLPMSGIAIGEMISVYNTNQFQPFIVAYIRHKLKYQFADLVEGGNVSNLYFRYLEEVKIPLPSKDEQTRIANVLSNINEIITQLDELIAKKKSIKQGAMQKLLTPKKDWEVKKVMDIAKVGRGRVISHREIALSNSKKYPVYSSQTSNNGVMGYLDTFDFEGEYITWTTDGENAGTVFYRQGKFNCTNVCGTIKLQKDNHKFIAILLNSVTSKYVSRNLANPKLMNDPMKKIEISIPSLEEQTYIATILSDMDQEIQQLEEKKAKYEQVKQGAMQQLLTGKIRLVGQSQA